MGDFESREAILAVLIVNLGRNEKAKLGLNVRWCSWFRVGVL